MPPVERLVIERAVLGSDGIQLFVLNDGPDPVTIAQVTVDDAYWAFTASENRTRLGHLGRTRLDIPYPWVAGEAHLVKVMTSTGTTFDHEIPVAVRTPSAEPRQLARLHSDRVVCGRDSGRARVDVVSARGPAGPHRASTCFWPSRSGCSCSS